MKGKLIAWRGDRLGARLNAVLNAIRLSQVTNSEYAIIWGPCRDYPIDGYELFDEQFINSHFIDHKAHKELNLKTLNAGMTSDSAILSATLDSGQNIRITELKPIVFGDENSQDVLNKIPDIFKEIPWNLFIRQCIESIDLTCSGRIFTSIHIRRGDMLSDDIRFQSPGGKFIPNSIYLKLIKDLYNQGHEIIVFSDDEDLIAEFKKSVPCILESKDIFSYAEATEFQRTLIDMYIMSKGDKIFGPGVSAFSNVAAVIAAKNLERADKNVEEDVQIELVSNDVGNFSGGDGKSNILHVLNLVYLANIFTKKRMHEKSRPLLEEAARYDPRNFSIAVMCAENNFYLDDLSGALNWSTTAARAIVDHRVHTAVKLKCYLTHSKILLANALRFGSTDERKALIEEAADFYKIAKSNADKGFNNAIFDSIIQKNAQDDREREHLTELFH